MEQAKHIDMQTPNGAELNLDALYKIAPSCFTEAKGEDGEVRRVVDFNKLRLLLGDQTVEDAPEVYDFTWVGKRAALQEAVAPINKTLRPCPEESVDWDNTQNLYIEGDNLEVLKLLQNSYMGKVKMIYIDPPYNTGNDFIYMDKRHLSESDYEEQTVDDEKRRLIKNTYSNGTFHSVWCNEIYKPLMVARSLLTEDGVIFISIDDHEVDNLRKICDEVFGSTNFVTSLHVEMSATQGMKVKAAQNGNIVKNAEYVLIYSKDGHKNIAKEILYDFRPEYDSHYSKFLSDDMKVLNLIDVYNSEFPSSKIKNVVSAYASEPLFKSFVEKNLSRIFRYDKTTGFNPSDFEIGKVVKIERDQRYYTIERKMTGVEQLMFLSASYGYCDNFRNSYGLRKIRGDWWKEFYLDMGNVSKEGNMVFENGKKPVRLILQLVKMCSSKDDIVLDFFSGSATTAHAVMQLNAEDNGNRKFIMVQLPEKTLEGSETYEAGYKNICEIGKERIRRAGKKIKEEHPDTKDLDIGFRVFKCESSNYKDVAFAPKDYSQDMLAGLLDNIKEDRTDLDLLFDCMLRWGVKLSMPLSSRKMDGCTIHNVNDGDLVACFDGNVTEKVIDAIAALSPVRVVFRDSSFNEAAQKMNLFELFKQKCDWSDEEVRNNVRVI